MAAQSEWLKTIAKNIRSHGEDITHEPLPRRWVELILHLDEQARTHARRSEGETQPRRLPN